MILYRSDSFPRRECEGSSSVEPELRTSLTAAQFTRDARLRVVDREHGFLEHTVRALSAFEKLVQSVSLRDSHARVRNRFTSFLEALEPPPTGSTPGRWGEFVRNLGVVCSNLERAHAEVVELRQFPRILPTVLTARGYEISRSTVIEYQPFAAVVTTPFTGGSFGRFIRSPSCVLLNATRLAEHPEEREPTLRHELRHLYWNGLELSNEVDESPVLKWLTACRGVSYDKGNPRIPPPRRAHLMQQVRQIMGEVWGEYVAEICEQPRCDALERGYVFVPDALGATLMTAGGQLDDWFRQLESLDAEATEPHAARRARALMEHLRLHVDRVLIGTTKAFIAADMIGERAMHELSLLTFVVPPLQSHRLLRYLENRYPNEHVLSAAATIPIIHEYAPTLTSLQSVHDLGGLADLWPRDIGSLRKGWERFAENSRTGWSLAQLGVRTEEESRRYRRLARPLIEVIPSLNRVSGRVLLDGSVLRKR